MFCRYQLCFVDRAITYYGHGGTRALHVALHGAIEYHEGLDGKCKPTGSTPPAGGVGSPLPGNCEDLCASLRKAVLILLLLLLLLLLLPLVLLLCLARKARKVCLRRLGRMKRRPARKCIC